MTQRQTPLPSETPAAQAWHEAVTTFAATAKAKLPQCASRIDRAVELVLAGHVELLPDGSARVRSQTDGQTTYPGGQWPVSLRGFSPGARQPV